MSIRLAKRSIYSRAYSTCISPVQIFDPYGQLIREAYVRRSRKDFQDDARAMAGDWAMIGQDLSKAAKKVIASQ